MNRTLVIIIVVAVIVIVGLLAFSQGWFQGRVPARPYVPDNLYRPVVNANQ